jgi:hypothetical protein
MKTTSLEQLSSNMEGMNGIGTVLGPFIYALLFSLSKSEIIPFLVFFVVLLLNVKNILTNCLFLLPFLSSLLGHCVLSVSPKATKNSYDNLQHF